MVVWQKQQCRIALGGSRSLSLFQVIDKQDHRGQDGSITSISKMPKVLSRGFVCLILQGYPFCEVDARGTSLQRTSMMLSPVSKLSLMKSANIWESPSWDRCGSLANCSWRKRRIMKALAVERATVDTCQESTANFEPYYVISSYVFLARANLCVNPN